MTRKNLRRNERIPSGERVELRWDDAADQPKYVIANCLNVSDDGISVRLDNPLMVRSYVTVRCAKLKLAGTASVKYCIRKNTWYQVGLEFAPGMKFNQTPVFSASE